MHLYHNAPRLISQNGGGGGLIVRMSINGTPVLIFSLCGGRQPGSRVLINSTGYPAPSELLSALSTDLRVITTPGELSTTYSLYSSTVSFSVANIALRVKLVESAFLKSGNTLSIKSLFSGNSVCGL